MLRLEIAALYAGVNILILLVLAVLVVGGRRKHKIVLGDGGKRGLSTAPSAPTPTPPNTSPLAWSGSFWWRLMEPGDAALASARRRNFFDRRQNFTRRSACMPARSTSGRVARHGADLARAIC